MFTLSRSRFLGIAAVGAFVPPPVSREPRLARTWGGRASRAYLGIGARVIAFYEPGGGHCTINVVVWDRSDDMAIRPRVRVSLNPRQMVHIDSAEASRQSSVRLADACACRRQTLMSLSSITRVQWTSAHVLLWKKSPRLEPEGHLWHFHRRKWAEADQHRRKRHAEDVRGIPLTRLRRADWRREAVADAGRHSSSRSARRRAIVAPATRICRQGRPQDLPLA
jgi:hypothetical protein